MRERELIIQELWKRLSNTPGVERVTRNPWSTPSENDFPLIQIFELEDKKVHQDQRGSYPIYTRSLSLVIEFFIKGSTEALSTQELSSFVQEGKKLIYEGGNSLGKPNTSITETGSSRILRPQVGGNPAGISINFTILYMENISTLF